MTGNTRRGPRRGSAWLGWRRNGAPARMTGNAGRAVGGFADQLRAAMEPGRDDREHRRRQSAREFAPESPEWSPAGTTGEHHVVPITGPGAAKWPQWSPAGMTGNTADGPAGSDTGMAQPQWSPAGMTGNTSRASVVGRLGRHHAAMEPGRDDREHHPNLPFHTRGFKVPQWSPAGMTGNTRTARRGPWRCKSSRNGARPG